MHRAWHVALRRPRKDSLVTGLLGVAVVALGAQLVWPPISDWIRSPWPGSQGVIELEAGTGRGYVNKDALLYLPPEYDTGQQWPLIVWLHGSGERGRHLSDLDRYGLPKFLAEGDDLPAMVLSPQCAQDFYWDPAVVFSVIDEVRSRYPVNPRRIYLVGYSMGAYGVWDALAAAPDRFAAAVALAGGGNPQSVSPPTDCLIWAVHGSDDKNVLSQRTKEMVEAYRSEGWQVKHSLLRGMGHDLGDFASPHSEIIQWLLRQSKQIQIDETYRHS